MRFVILTSPGVSYAKSCHIHKSDFNLPRIFINISNDHANTLKDGNSGQ